MRLARPYGANERMEKWATLNGYRFSPSARCLHWISKGRCGVGLCRDGHGSRQWMDHVSGWTKDGERMLLSQPYWLSEITSLLKACIEFNLEVSIHGNGWYGHGTIAIEFRKKPDDRELK